MSTPLDDEAGTIRKKWTGRLPVALLYPNLYPVAVSNLGYQLVYALLNADEDLVCERFVYPDKGAPLRSLESSRPLTDFPLVFASISFEHDYPRLAAMLAAGGIPPLAAERSGRIEAGKPLVLIGGVAMFINPEPLAAFADLVALGEAEAILPQLTGVVKQWAEHAREDLLYRINATIEGCYAPSLYHFDYDKNGRLQYIRPEQGLPARVKKTVLAEAPLAGHSRLYSPQAELDMHMVELGRGCSQACRFCAAGYVYRPPRLWQQDAVAAALRHRPGQVRRVGLLGMEMSTSLDTARLATDLQGSGCMLSFSSLRADRLSPQLLSVLGQSELKSAAIAADGASERLRRVINKNIKAQNLLSAAVQLVEAGIFHLKIYLMIGLPGEGEADLLEFAALIRSIRAAILPLGRARGRVTALSLSINCFVPKAWTPFQYCSFGGLSPEEDTGLRPEAQVNRALASLKEKAKFLRHLLKDEANLHFICDSPDQALEQAVYARADRRIAPVLLARGAGRLSFKMAMKHFIDQGNKGNRENRGRPGFGIWDYALRPRSQDELFPWDVIEHGFSPGYMWQEYGRALREFATSACEPERCRRCGVCHASA